MTNSINNTVSLSVNTINILKEKYRLACEALLKASKMEEDFAVRLYNSVPEASQKAAWERMVDMESICVDEGEISQAQAGRYLLGMASGAESAWWQDKEERCYLRRAQDLKETIYWRVNYLRYEMMEEEENMYKCPNCKSDGMELKLLSEILGKRPVEGDRHVYARECNACGYIDERVVDQGLCPCCKKNPASVTNGEIDWCDECCKEVPF